MLLLAQMPGVQRPVQSSWEQDWLSGMLASQEAALGGGLEEEECSWPGEERRLGAWDTDGHSEWRQNRVSSITQAAFHSAENLP